MLKFVLNALNLHLFLSTHLHICKAASRDRNEKGVFFSLMERTPQTNVGGQFGIKNKVNVGIKCIFFLSQIDRNAGKCT